MRFYFQLAAKGDRGKKKKLLISIIKKPFIIILSNCDPVKAAAQGPRPCPPFASRHLKAGPVKSRSHKYAHKATVRRIPKPSSTKKPPMPMPLSLNYVSAVINCSGH